MSRSFLSIFALSLLYTPIALSQVQPPQPKTTVIRFYSPVTEQSVSQLLTAVDQKLKTGTQRFVLLISSPGGSVFAGLSAYAYLKGIPAEIITHNFGEVDSIATVIYCAGSKRYSVPQGRFLMHGVAINFAPNIPFDEGAINEQLKLMQQQVNSIASVIAETVKKPAADVQNLISQHTVYSATEAQQFGLVQDIRSKLYEEGADVISIGELRLPGRDTQVATALPKETTYTTNINRVFTILPDFSTQIPEFSTEHFEFFTRPLNQLYPKLDP